ncbi:hypothetical protein SAMN04244572_04544 [Azotobacter beijerinckii]|uniref:Uncharacterized protein n=1 Tax=Azotobacter beijerinckii TaxID=170623 RepID=A0A1H6ZWA3_9GAMM|nr:hypothetical protein [Azotobacter beijerinckii]SEJ43763.1 hypothetical protein SAMN04244579_04360 [Azotobacter beijerinckii]SEJ57743.1 hypothetical protein SAMN04244572_04544 [Azotobacter beijerinckii]
MIAVQLIDSTGRVLGNLRLPSGVRLADLEQLALAAGHRSLSEHLEQYLATEVRAQVLEVGVLA